MTTLTYCFEGYTKLKDGALVFAKDGLWVVEVELDIETDGDDWDVKTVRLVEPHIVRQNADAFELTEDGPLLKSAREMISGEWRDNIHYHIAAEYEAPEDDRAIEAWKDAG